MKIITTKELKKIIKQKPDGGVVFAEYYDMESSFGDILVTDGLTGATYVAPVDGEVYSFDWDINQIGAQLFVLFEDADVLQMIQTLSKRLNITLSFE